MKIAIASSGLGHITRGVEAWAQETFKALREIKVDVELFGGPDWKGEGQSLFAFRRDSRITRILARILPGFMWRWGLKSTYGWEQFSFWLALWQKLSVNRFDILHVQDPMVAFWCRFFREHGLVRTREILAHGTEEPPWFLSQFPFVQHLSPWHLEHVRENIEEENVHFWYVIPNLVDTEIFKPCRKDEKIMARVKFGLPADAFIVGTVSAVQKTHKRIDYAVKEFRRFVLLAGESAKVHFVIAGASTEESKEIKERVAGLPGITVLLNLPRADMPVLYNSMDVFVLCSLFEMQPMAILEAMSAGIPVILNKHPALEWVAGIGCVDEKPAGISINMQLDDELAKQLFAFYREPGRLQEYSIFARLRAEKVFSRDIVASQMLQMYREVMDYEAKESSIHFL
jgi:glycosyltransferase involved in cell wall biosynthesis